MITEDQFKVLVERIDRIQIVVDKIEADIDKVYKDNQELAIRVGGAENQLRELRSSVHNLPQETKNKVSDAVKPVINEAKELKETIQDKKIVVIKESTNFFKRVWKWWCAGW
ncbi:hypothetical protein M1437_02545 [Patescibacteria group bacterium]|nr:hypothetical protein [Patescibacteria group bacterium]